MCYIGGEPFEEWIEASVTARRAFRCHLCAMVIRAEQTHIRISYLDDGSWTTVRAHADCFELSRFISDEVCNAELYMLVKHDLVNDAHEHFDHESLGREVWSRYRRVVRARMREGVWVSPRTGRPQRRAA